MVFIDATYFKSVEELGAYLNYLDKNNTVYNKKEFFHAEICLQ